MSLDLVIDEYEVSIIKHPTMGHLCGYVRVPESHPWYNKGYSQNFCGHPGCNIHTPESIIKVHGGLTFSGLPHGKKEGHWFGFDCAHLGDKVAGVSDDGFYRDEAYVKRELKSLVKQLRESEQ